MAKIKIKDISKNQKISREELNRVMGGASGVPGSSFNPYGASGVPGTTLNPYAASGVPGGTFNPYAASGVPGLPRIYSWK